MVAAPKHMARALTGLRHLSRAVSREELGSANRNKATRRLARAHARVANCRRDFLQPLSSELVKTHAELAIEDLAVKNLVRNKRLSRHIADASWGSFEEVLCYKATWHGTTLVVAPRLFPSTKTCSSCGWVKEKMTLAAGLSLCGTGLRLRRRP